MLFVPCSCWADDLTTIISYLTHNPHARISMSYDDFTAAFERVRDPLAGPIEQVTTSCSIASRSSSSRRFAVKQGPWQAHRI